LRFGDTTLRIHHHGRAHTEADLCVEVVEDRVLYAGDVVMNGRIANMDDGSYRGTLKTIDALVAAVPGALWVPGHGAASRALPAEQREFFAGLYEPCLAAVKAGPDRAMKVAGTGSRQEDHIITVILEKTAGKKMTYVPFKGGGAVAVQLVGKHVDATVNNPIEAESHWRAGTLRALCVFDSKPMPYTAKVTATQSWADLPTCKSAGLPAEYQMLRGIFTTPGATPEQVKFYVDLMAKVRGLPEWKEFMEKGAFNQTTMSGQAYFDWVAKNEQLHRELMREAGFLAK
jgi:hypothetical protein